jgi:hypothetical protein
MAEVIKIYKESVPAMRFIGKKYLEKDRENGGFGKKWDEWFSNGWFEELEKSIDAIVNYANSEAYVGLMRWKENEEFEYWIGIFCSTDSKVPNGYSFVDFEEADLGVTWLYGKKNDVFGKEEMCAEKLKDSGYKIIPDIQGAYWFFERYVCPRFTTPDEKGNIILDICQYIEK